MCKTLQAYHLKKLKWTNKIFCFPFLELNARPNLKSTTENKVIILRIYLVNMGDIMINYEISKISHFNVTPKGRDFRDERRLYEFGRTNKSGLVTVTLHTVIVTLNMWSKSVHSIKYYRSTASDLKIENQSL